MIKDFFFEKICSNLLFTPTTSQLKAIEILSEFSTSVDPKPLFLLTGYAGTGKTALMKSFVKTLSNFDIKTVLLAPTGRAAKVLSANVGEPAYTIHKKIYRQQSSNNGLGSFQMNKNLHKNTVFIVDESSMISNQSYGSSIFGSGRLLEDLINYVYANNCKLLLIGDSAQLPPVGLEMSPALEILNLESYGVKLWHAMLTDVVRQKMDGGILNNATYLRSLLDEHDKIDFYPKLQVGTNDVKQLSGADLMEELNYCFDHYGLEETIVICRTNKRANLYNQGIRNSVLFREDELTTGDYLLVMKNNYHWLKEDDKASFIANGDIAKVTRIKKYYELYGFRFADITCELVDYSKVDIDARIILDSIQSEGAGLSQQQQEEFYNKVMEDYETISPASKRYEKIRADDFYNALQVKFAYAMTCHKAQGGQWKAVFIDLGYFTEEYLSREMLRWLYTAVTRATEKLYFVNFPKEFYKSKL